MELDLFCIVLIQIQTMFLIQSDKRSLCICRKTYYKARGIMKNKTIKTPLAAAMSSIVVSAFTTNVAIADADPFAVSELSDGYMQLAESEGYTVVPWEGGKANEASCGEGKCGSDADKKVMKDAGGSCGAKHKKSEKAAEAKCGEGKCGDMMDGKKMKKGLEKSCGEMMKGNEGSCGVMDKPAESKGGEMSCGSKMEKKKGMKGGMDMGGKDGEMSCGAMMEKMKKMKGGMDMGGKDGEMSCGAMMEKMKKMKGDMGDKDMKGGEMSCGSNM